MLYSEKVKKNFVDVTVLRKGKKKINKEVVHYGKSDVQKIRKFGHVNVKMQDSDRKNENI